MSSTEVATRSEKCEAMDVQCASLAQNYMTSLMSPTSGQFEVMQKTGMAIKALTEMLDDDMMKPIMYMQGHSLGFKTDRDRKGEKYAPAVVKAAVIDALMHGLKINGNEFNIISANMYITKNGYRAILNRLLDPGWEIFVKPFTKTDKEACVTVVANYIFKGNTVKDFTRDFQIVVHTTDKMQTGPDAIRAKAKRKMYAEIVEIITNGAMQAQDGEVDDVDYREAKVVETSDVPEKILKEQGEKKPDSFGNSKQAVLTEEDAASEPENGRATEEELLSAAQEQEAEQGPSNLPPLPQTKYQQLQEASENDLRGFLKACKKAKQSFPDFPKIRNFRDIDPVNGMIIAQLLGAYQNGK